MKDFTEGFVHIPSPDIINALYLFAAVDLNYNTYL